MAKTLREIAEQCYRAHRKQLADPNQLGEIARVWTEGQVVCIEYTSGAWYHYTYTASGLTWY